MKTFQIPSHLEIQGGRRGVDSCYDYAIHEVSRFLNTSGIITRVLSRRIKGVPFSLFVGLKGASVPALPKIPPSFFPDDYIISVFAQGVLIVSSSTKGILNGVYDIAEKIGYAFLLPGPEGELAPETLRSLPLGRTASHSRFRYRGVFFGGMTHDYEVGEWIEFYAKLRFNAVSLHGPDFKDPDLALRLGIRMETGGHGYRELLPRKLLSRKANLFRMDQPQDFGGKRVGDFNSCAANGEARAIIRENFRTEVKEASKEGFYALHRWPDDLPGGGWCFCPHCRAFEPSDQAMLAMRNLGEVILDEQLPMRVPMLAYHDTMEPAGNVPPSKETYLLFAPRERCYGHRLDDPKCARNRHYMSALVRWSEKYKGIGDAHTFEYYFDQILYRGLHPYIPEVIAGDMQAYERSGIESHMVLHIAGTAVSPDWNMLFFARNLWDANLSAQSFNASFPLTFAEGPMAASWTRYLDARAKAFTSALVTCDHEIHVYMDYRWLPGTTKPFGSKMVELYQQSSQVLARASGRLESETVAVGQPRLRRLAQAEVARSRFESAELRVMSCQQDSVNQAARFLISRKPSEVKAAVVSAEAAIEAFRPALALAKKARISQKCWYFGNINRWLTRELKGKVKDWTKEINTLKVG